MHPQQPRCGKEHGRPHQPGTWLSTYLHPLPTPPFQTPNPHPPRIHLHHTPPQGSLLFTGPPRSDYDANIVAAYTRTGVASDLTPDVELGFIMGPPAEDPAVWGHVPSLYVFYCLWLLHDGVGAIRLKSKDPLEDPIVISGYLRSANDEKRLVRIFRMLLDWAAEFASVTGLRLEQQPAGGNAINVNRRSTDEEIVRAAKTVLSTHWHVAQSCRMGDPAKDREAVVDTRWVGGGKVWEREERDEYARVHPSSSYFRKLTDVFHRGMKAVNTEIEHRLTSPMPHHHHHHLSRRRFNLLGVEALRVVDASSQPVLTNGHPMAVLVAMAERAADFVAQDREARGEKRRRVRR